MKKPIKVVQALPEPFDHIEIRVNLLRDIDGTERGHSVAIYNNDRGTGQRGGLDYAEAEAKGVLKAIRAYRRKLAREQSDA